MLSFMFAMIRCLREDAYQLKDSIQSGEGDLQVAAKFSSTRNALHACSRFFPPIILTFTFTVHYPLDLIYKESKYRLMSTKSSAHR